MENQNSKTGNTLTKGKMTNRTKGGKKKFATIMFIASAAIIYCISILVGPSSARPSTSTEVQAQEEFAKKLQGAQERFQKKLVSALEEEKASSVDH